MHNVTVVTLDILQVLPPDSESWRNRWRIWTRIEKKKTL